MPSQSGSQRSNSARRNFGTISNGANVAPRRRLLEAAGPAAIDAPSPLTSGRARPARTLDSAGVRLYWRSAAACHGVPLRATACTALFRPTCPINHPAQEMLARDTGGGKTARAEWRSRRSPDEWQGVAARGGAGRGVTATRRRPMSKPEVPSLRRVVSSGR